MNPRAGILVTGTEVLSGAVRDRNGPWLAEQLEEVGVSLAIIAIVGDRPRDMLDALSTMRDASLDLIITSGGLGPTADDLTAEVVGEFLGRPMVVDHELEGRIAAILRSFAVRWPNVDPQAVEVANRKQATIPRGATVLEPVGTAPGLALASSGKGEPTVLVLPGPPRELQPMWRQALATDELQALLGTTTPRIRARMLLYGVPESQLAATLRGAVEAGVSLEQLEITTCLHRGEIDVSTSYAPAAATEYAALQAFLRERHPRELFSADGRSVDEFVAEALRARDLTIATAESCTGGLLAARLTEPPGASAYVRGGVVAYDNQVKVTQLDVAASLIAEHGAVSREVARALAQGVRGRLDVDVGVGITGVAGPGGGTEEKPVGLVCVAVAWAAGELVRGVNLPGGRADVRERAVTVAMHQIRRLLDGERDGARDGGDDRGATARAHTRA